MRSRSAHVPCVGSAGQPLPYRADDAFNPRDDPHGHGEAHKEYDGHSSASNFGSNSFFRLGFLRKMKWYQLAIQRAKEVGHGDLDGEAPFVDVLVSSLKRQWREVRLQLGKRKGARSKRSASVLALILSVTVMIAVVLLIMYFGSSSLGGRTNGKPSLATTPFSSLFPSSYSSSPSSDKGAAVSRRRGGEDEGSDDAIANELLDLLSEESKNDRRDIKVLFNTDKKEVKDRGADDDDDGEARGKKVQRRGDLSVPLPPPPPLPAAGVGAEKLRRHGNTKALVDKAERSVVAEKDGSGGREENQKEAEMGKKGGEKVTTDKRRRNNLLEDDSNNDRKEFEKEKQVEEEGGRSPLPFLSHVDGRDGKEERRGNLGAPRVGAGGAEVSSKQDGTNVSDLISLSSVPRSILENYVFGTSLLPIDKSTEEGKDALRYLFVSPSEYGEECGEGGEKKRGKQRQGDDDDDDYVRKIGERPNTGSIQKDDEKIKKVVAEGRMRRLIVGDSNSLSSNGAEVIPRFIFDNVHTSPLALTISSGARGMLPAASQQSLSTSEFIDMAFATNIILRLYKDIPPSLIDSAPAFSRPENEKEGFGERKRSSNNEKNKAASAGAPSAFFSLMDEGLYSLHPVRRIVEDYLEKGEERHEQENDGDDGVVPTYERYLHTNPPIRAGTAGGGRGRFWTSQRPLLKQLLMRYQSFHAEGIARLRKRLSSASSRNGPEKGTKMWGGERGIGSGGLSDEDFSQFVVVQPVGQLCNRLVAIASAFLFALMTRRVLLVDDGDFYCSLNDLFATPGMVWIWSDDAAEEALKKWNYGGRPSGGAHEEERSPLQQRGRKDFFLLDFSKLEINDRFEKKLHLQLKEGEARAKGADKERAASEPILNPKYGHVLSPTSSSFGIDRVHHYRAAVMPLPPLSVLQRAFATSGAEHQHRQHQHQQGQAQGLREYVVANPEAGMWQETEKLLCSDDYRTTYNSKGTLKANRGGGENIAKGGNIHHEPRPSPSVVTFAVNQYLVPYFYRNPFYHNALVEIFGLMRKRGEDGGFFHGAGGFGEGGIFHPIAHFLFRPLPSLIRKRDDFIRDHFFDKVSKRSYKKEANDVYVPSFVVGLQVRAGDDFTGNAMSREDWQLYRDCGLQASPPDTTLVASLPSSDKRRRFKFFVATDTAKGRFAAKTFLSQVPTQVQSFANNDDIPVLLGPGDFLLSNNPEGVRAALLDLLLLSASDDKVQTAWSSFGYFAAGISGVNGNLVTNRAPSFLSSSSFSGAAHSADKGRKAKAEVESGATLQTAETAMRKGVRGDDSFLKGKASSAAEFQSSNPSEETNSWSRCLVSAHHRLVTSRHHPQPLSELSILHLQTLARHKKGVLKNEKWDETKSVAAVEKADQGLRRGVRQQVGSKGGNDVGGKSQSQRDEGSANTIERVVHVLQFGRSGGGSANMGGGHDKFLAHNYGHDEHTDEGTNRDEILQHLQVAEPGYSELDGKKTNGDNKGKGWLWASSDSYDINGVRQATTRGLRVHFTNSFSIGVAGSEDFRLPQQENERSAEEVEKDGQRKAQKGGLSDRRRTDMYSQYRSIFFERDFTDRDRLGEQRYMGVMHKSDKRAQCVRLPTTEPCFHKYESWGASKTSCFDWRRMTFEEMIDGGRYC